MSAEQKYLVFEASIVSLLWDTRGTVRAKAFIIDLAFGPTRWSDPVHSARTHIYTLFCTANCYIATVICS
jgi:hypothetical protein